MSNENCTGVRILESTMEIAVRFSETDAMGVIWHGNYLKFFEDAREKFGKTMECNIWMFLVTDFIRQLLNRK